MEVPTSKNLKEIIKNPIARGRLRKTLIGDGTITVNDKLYV